MTELHRVADHDHHSAENGEMTCLTFGEDCTGKYYQVGDHFHRIKQGQVTCLAAAEMFDRVDPFGRNFKKEEDNLRAAIEIAQSCPEMVVHDQHRYWKTLGHLYYHHGLEKSAEVFYARHDLLCRDCPDCKRLGYSPEEDKARREMIKLVMKGRNSEATGKAIEALSYAHQTGKIDSV